MFGLASLYTVLGLGTLPLFLGLYVVYLSIKPLIDSTFYQQIVLVDLVAL